MAVRILSVFGTRPEAIKMAPLTLELSRRAGADSAVCVTGQHREMLDEVLRAFGIKPDFDLNIMSHGQTPADITSKVLKGMEGIFRSYRPDIVLVHGDTSTSTAAALAAFYEKLPVGHVEAGLRSHDIYSPFPEEMNRRLTSRIAAYHFAPTAGNAENLRREGITENVFITGNTVIDALSYTAFGKGFASEELSSLDMGGRRIIAMTCHRRENYGKPMENIFTAAAELARAFPDILIVYPVHPAAAVREAAAKYLSGIPNIKLISPLGAVDMHRLMAKSYLVMTDSGGIQEEAPSLGVPVVVLRRETERPEAVEAGTVVLAGTEKENVFRTAAELLENRARHSAMAQAVNPYGDGRASERIADAVLYCFGESDKAPEEFRP